MTRRTTAARRLAALSIASVLAISSMACSNDDDGDSSQPTTPVATTDGGSEGTPSEPTAPADPLAPFADIDETEMNAYCDSVQAALPLGLDNAQPIIDAAPPAIAAEYENVMTLADAGAAGPTPEAAISLYRLTKLHEDVCGIPVNFG